MPCSLRWTNFSKNEAVTKGISGGQIWMSLSMQEAAKHESVHVLPARADDNVVEIVERQANVFQLFTQQEQAVPITAPRPRR